MYSKVKQILGKEKFNKSIAIKKSDGNVATNIGNFKLVWSEYVGDFYYEIEIFVENNSKRNFCSPLRDR